ncbi:SNARE domain protein [Penicillium macrosclerotiorum]|uniref:SNARE domain protein n=1 Tax=Penicillium macrosclerotiorum TaxID=303699 RepID=UPI002549A61E|nr:SNARE domain protein [Penicillium macrosclerotiorum]KAJ5698971.1 SNARE domain protein [Penicillium macrosclerotiorum]
MNGYERDLESGQEQYALQNTGDMAIVLTKRRKIDQDLRQVALKQEQLQSSQQALLDSTTAAEDYQAGIRIDAVKEEISGCFQRIREHVASLKRDSDMSNPLIQQQIKFISENVQRQIQLYSATQQNFEGKLRSQVRRRYEIVHQGATPEEITAGMEGIINGGEQAFAIQGMRSAQAIEARNAVLQRSVAIRRIEQDMKALAEMYQDIGSLVEQQTYPAQEIQDKAEATANYTKDANEQMSRAIISLRNANKWKWWILLVGVLIVAVIVGGTNPFPPESVFGVICGGGWARGAKPRFT